MKVVSKMCFLMLLGSVIMCADLINKQQTVSQQISNFHAKITQWKQKLTKEQKAFFQPLFEMYDDLYKEYKLHISHASKQAMVMDITKAIEHVMNHWQSFYKNNIAAQMFDRLLQNWKKLNPEKLAAVSKHLQLYQQAYKAYDQQPTNAQAYEQLLKQQQKLNSLISISN